MFTAGACILCLSIRKHVIQYGYKIMLGYALKRANKVNFSDLSGGN